MLGDKIHPQAFLLLRRHFVSSRGAERNIKALRDLANVGFFFFSYPGEAKGKTGFTN